MSDSLVTRVIQVIKEVMVPQGTLVHLEFQDVLVSTEVTVLKP